MNTLSRFLKPAAWSQVVISVTNLVIAVGVLPALGFRGMNDFADPETARRLLAPLTALEVLKFASAVAIVIVVLAFSRRWPFTVMKVGTVAGVIGALLLTGAGWWA